MKAIKTLHLHRNVSNFLDLDFIVLLLMKNLHQMTPSIKKKKRAHAIFSVVLLKNASSVSEINKKIRLWNSQCAVANMKQQYYIYSLARKCQNCI